MKIDVPTHALLIVSGGKKADLDTPVAGLDWPTMEWDISKPDLMAPLVHELLGDNVMRAIIKVRFGHQAARKTMARIAAKRGLVPIVLTVGPHDVIDQDVEKVAAVYAVEQTVTVKDVPMRTDRTNDSGPFDIIGDVHGTFDELMMLLHKLGHAIPKKAGKGFKLIRHPQGRRVILLGDLTDRGPKNRKTVTTARRLEREFKAIIIKGNHDEKLAKWLEGRKVTIRPHTGISETVAEYEDMPIEERLELGKWLATRGDHYVLDGGQLVVAHAGMDEANQGRITNGAQSFALYGPVTGELDADGHPEAHDWISTYRGEAYVVHGHVVTVEPKIVNRVVSIDTGAVFGGKLTAFRWPEKEFVSVPALKTYWEGDTFAKLKAAA